MTLFKFKSVLYSFVILLAVASCSGRQGDGADAAEAAIPFEFSTLLRVSQGDGYRHVVVRNPWDTASVLNSYVLVPDTCELPARLPEGTVIRTPLRRAVVYSGVHQLALGSIGAIEAVGGICDREYVTDSTLTARLANDAIADCGNNMSPNLERIIMLEPDAVLLSPYENSGNYGTLGTLGVPLVECADYMEPTPLGRAEWIRFLGMLTGREAEADSLFNDTRLRYERLRELASSAHSKPKVLVDCIYGQGWTVPSARSYTSAIINDAGGVNPFDYLDGAAGTNTLAPEQVFHRAGDADVWLLRYFRYEDMTLESLGADNPLYGRFNAFANGNVYGCNTSRKHFYEEVPFQPHLYLEDIIAILHPELAGDSIKPRYYTQLR